MTSNTHWIDISNDLGHRSRTVVSYTVREMRGTDVVRTVATFETFAEALALANSIAPPLPERPWA